MKNVFIEGIQGTGKSTLENELAKRLPAYKVYREGDLSPVELAWCSYMSEEQYNETLARFSCFEKEIQSHMMPEGDKRIVAYTRILTDMPEFYRHMENYEIYNGRVSFEYFRKIIFERYDKFNTVGNIFECSLFQNAVECMMLYYEMNDESIMEFYRDLYYIIRDKNPVLIYLEAMDVKEGILQIKRERSGPDGREVWFPLVMNYLRTSPYGRRHGCGSFDDLIAHLERRKRLELRIIQEIMESFALQVHAKNYDISAIISEL